MASKDIYFIIYYQREQQENPKELVFEENNIIPKNILTNELRGERVFIYIKVFKFYRKIKDNNLNNNKSYCLNFEIGKDDYIISFKSKNNSFVFDVELKKHIRILKMNKEIIDQKNINYYDKFELFLEALKKNNEEDKTEALYKEAIELYSKKKEFSFLIPLFISIYKIKDLCILLMAKFKEMNNKIRQFKKNKNMDRNEDLEQYKKIFHQIASEAGILIKNNGYDSIQFYAIILCYLNFYDYDFFLKIFDKLLKEKNEILYEILIIYSPQFLNPIPQNLDFFVEFIHYGITNNEFDIFENGLKYIIYIDIFIIVIEKTKEEIINKYAILAPDLIPLKINPSLEFIKKENKIKNNIILAIDSIINYCKDKKVLLIDFTSNFWHKLLQNYDEPDEINIVKCYQLREIFIKYNNLDYTFLKKVKEIDIKKDIKKYFEIDEFAFILDKNIKKFLDINKEKKELSNSEIIGFALKYNPYYNEEKYSYKRETYIFDYVNLDDINEQYIETLKAFEFERMFKDNIIEFLNKMTSKIKNISNFGTILELIDT